MDFGEAIRALKEGKRVARAGWNGKGMWLQLQRPTRRLMSKSDGPPGNRHHDELRAYIEMKDATDFFVPWLASQTDMLADDWELV